MKEIREGESGVYSCKYSYTHDTYHTTLQKYTNCRVLSAALCGTAVWCVSDSWGHTAQSALGAFHCAVCAAAQCTHFCGQSGEPANKPPHASLPRNQSGSRSFRPAAPLSRRYDPCAPPRLPPPSAAARHRQSPPLAAHPVAGCARLARCRRARRLQPPPWLSTRGPLDGVRVAPAQSVLPSAGVAAAAHPK